MRWSVLEVIGAGIGPVFFGLLALGAWKSRHDLRCCALSAGPLLYFSLLHMIFASSVRYRIPGEIPALRLVATGWMAFWSWSHKAKPTLPAAGEHHDA
jgi:hypothetical protein